MHVCFSSKCSFNCYLITKSYETIFNSSALLYCKGRFFFVSERHWQCSTNKPAIYSLHDPYGCKPRKSAIILENCLFVANAADCIPMPGQCSRILSHRGRFFHVHYRKTTGKLFAGNHKKCHSQLISIIYSRNNKIELATEIVTLVVDVSPRELRSKNCYGVRYVDRHCKTRMLITWQLLYLQYDALIGSLKETTVSHDWFHWCRRNQ